MPTSHPIMAPPPCRQPEYCRSRWWKPAAGKACRQSGVPSWPRLRSGRRLPGREKVEPGGIEPPCRCAERLRIKRFGANRESRWCRIRCSWRRNGAKPGSRSRDRRMATPARPHPQDYPDAHRVRPRVTLFWCEMISTCVDSSWPAPALPVRGAPQATHGAGIDRVAGWRP